MSTIQLKTEVPGPRSRELFARREATVPRGPFHVTPIFTAEAHGAVRPRGLPRSLRLLLLLLLFCDRLLAEGALKVRTYSALAMVKNPAPDLLVRYKSLQEHYKTARFVQGAARVGRVMPVTSESPLRAGQAGT